MSQSIPLRIIGNSTLRLVSTFINFVFAFTLSVVATRVLQPEAYGTYSLLMWLVGIIVVIPGLGWGKVITKHVAELQGRQEPSLIGGAIVHVVWWSSVFVVVALPLTMMLAPRLPALTSVLAPEYLWLIAGLAITTIILNQVEALLTGLQYFRTIVLGTLLASGLTFALSIIFFWQGWSLYGLLISSLVGTMGGVAGYTFFLARLRLPLSFGPMPTHLRSRLSSYGTSMAIITLIDSIVWQRSEMLFLGLLHNSAQSGYYNVAYSLSSIAMTLIPGALTSAVMPLIAQMDGGGHRRAIGHIFTTSSHYLALLALPVGFGGIAIARPLVNAIYGHGYEPVVGVLQILLVGGMVAALASASSSVLYGTNGQWFIVKYGLGLSVVNLLLDVLLIPNYGALGASLANTVTQLGALGGLYYVVHSYKLVYPVKSVGKALASSILMWMITHTLVSSASDLWALPIIIVVAIIVYFSSFLLLKGLTASDRAVLQSIARRLPNTWQRLYLRLIDGIPYSQEAQEKATHA